MSLLLRRPLLYQDESLASYVARLGAASYCQPPTLFTNLVLSERFNQAQPGNRDNLHLPQRVATFIRLAAYSGVEPIELYRATAHRFANLFIAPEYKVYHLELAGEERPILTSPRDSRVLRSLLDAQFCPNCLAEECYQRLNWQLEIVTICLKHNCLLLDGCQNCQHKLSVSAVALGKCEHCQAALSAMQALGVGEETESLLFQSVIEDWLDESEGDCAVRIGSQTTLSIRTNAVKQAQLPGQTPAILLRVLTGLRQAVQCMNLDWPYYYQPQLMTKSKTPGLRGVDANGTHSPAGSTYSNHCEYLTAFRGLKDWPQGFYDFLDAYRQVEYRLKPESHKNHLGLGILYNSWLGQKWKRSGYYWLQNSFEQYELKQNELDYRYILMNSKRGRVHKKLAYMTLEEAAIFLKMDSWQVEKLLEAGGLKGYASTDLRMDSEGRTQYYTL
jgi:hypothetical protein